ncbi:MAG: ABC transporter permease, partial [Deltaproteobacteria bacterium]
MFWRKRKQTDFNAEVEAHLELEVARLREQGMSEEEARAAARRNFGNTTRAEERFYESSRWMWWDNLRQDVRYGLRQLRRNPGFTAVAVLTLALGIGANAAIFSVVNAVLLRPLPFPKPHQLVRLVEDNHEQGITNNGSSYVNFEECRKANRVFSELAGLQSHELTLTGRGEPSTVRTIVVTPELFSLLGVRPAAGRVFLPEEGKPGAAPVVLLSESFWRNRLGGDPGIIGSSISLDKRPFTVVGIMPAGFQFPLLEPSENIWIPLVQDTLFGSWMTQPGGHWLGVVGRLKAGVSLSQAQAEMDAINARLIREYPAQNSGWRFRLVPLQDSLVGKVRPALLILLGAVSLVLLIACVNIANLLITRAMSREKEMVVRAALGAGRGRIVRQLLVESMVLGLLGGAAGLLLAYAGVEALRAFLPPGLPQIRVIRVDRWVVGFALLVSAIAGAVAGLAPAILAAGAGLHAGARLGGRGVIASRGRLRSSLVVAEIALAMILLVGAGLLLRSFSALTSVDPGFRVEHLLTAEISLPRSKYATPQQWTAFSDELMVKIHAQPGLRDSAGAVPAPLADGFVNLAFDIAGSAPLPPGVSRTADYVSITPDYFRVMGIPLLQGRNFGSGDALSTSRVAIISDTLARMYFPGEDPIGKHLVFGFPPQTNVTREIVGVAGDVRDMGLGREPCAMMYVPFAQAPFWGLVVVGRTTLHPASAASVIRREVWSLDKD